MNSNLPSKGLKIDATNELLSQVPGLGFKIPGVAESKQPGAGAHKGMDPKLLQVEQTNELVSKVLGKEFITEEGPKKKIEEGIIPGMQPAAVVQEEAGLADKAKMALEHLNQAMKACEGVEGLEDYCEEIEDMAADLEDMIGSVGSSEE